MRSVGSSARWSRRRMSGQATPARGNPGSGRARASLHCCGTAAAATRRTAKDDVRWPHRKTAPLHTRAWMQMKNLQRARAKRCPPQPLVQLRLLPRKVIKTIYSQRCQPIVERLGHCAALEGVAGPQRRAPEQFELPLRGSALAGACHVVRAAKSGRSGLPGLLDRLGPRRGAAPRRPSA